MPAAEIDLLEQDLFLLSTQYTIRNRPGDEWTADERRRWAPEITTVLRLVQYELVTLPNAEDFSAQIDELCAAYERRDELQLTSAQRRVWAEKANRLAVRLVQTIRERSTVRPWDKAAAWNADMKDRRRVVTWKNARSAARPLTTMGTRAYDPHDPRSKPKRGKP